ncbi:hypothetical protein JW935_14610 [candidate division KSB1 bacterium]|nr:hypothetical protein [candidate division KSB1 bacterium]
MKPLWRKPELIVLYRGRPDENLLGRVYCKTTTPKNLPDNAAGIYCQFEHGGRVGDPCYDYAPS